jgi:hypothetical protein
MSTGRGDVDAAVAGLRARWGAAAPSVVGALAPGARSGGARRDPTIRPSARRPRHPDRVRGTRRDPRPRRPPEVGQCRDPGSGTSGRTTLSLRVVAEAQAEGSVVAWLDLSRSFDPVEAVARGVDLDWLVVITPASLDEGLSIAGACSPAGRSTCSSSTCPVGGLARTDTPARIGDRLHRLAALARRAETLLLILDAPGLGRRPCCRGRRVDRASGSSWRAGRGSGSDRDVVGQRTEALVAHNRHGPPGRRATLRILYAEGGERDTCLTRTPC